MLRGVVLSTPLLAGCVGGAGSDVKDSDDDGFVDGEDYAPNDPDVQEKSDLLTATPTVTVAPTRTPKPTTTPRPTAVPSTDAGPESVTGPTNRLRASIPDGYEINHISTYTAESATIRVRPDSLDTAASRLKLVLVTATYPRDELVATGTSGPFERSADSVTLTVPLRTGDVPDDTRVHHLAYVIPADETLDSVDTTDVEFLHETDAFTRSADRISRDPPAVELADESSAVFERTAFEGMYLLHLEGRTEGSDWWVEWLIWKSAYAQGVNEPRGRSYQEYVSYARSNGNAASLAEIFHDHAVGLGFEEKRQQVEFVVDVVQRLPYVTDDVSTGFDDYPKTVVETITEARGDCEDTAILTAAILGTEPFNYDMVLIRFSDHMGAGIYGKGDLPGYYWESDGRSYYYVETTGEGWGIGDLPESYEGEDAYVYQV